MSPSLRWLSVSFISHIIPQTHKGEKYFSCLHSTEHKTFGTGQVPLVSMYSPTPFQDPHKCFLAFNRAQETHWKAWFIQPGYLLLQPAHRAMVYFSQQPPTWTPPRTGCCLHHWALQFLQRSSPVCFPTMLPLLLWFPQPWMNVSN